MSPYATLFYGQVYLYYFFCLPPQPHWVSQPETRHPHDLILRDYQRPGGARPSWEFYVDQKVGQFQGFAAHPQRAEAIARLPASDEQ